MVKPSVFFSVNTTGGVVVLLEGKKIFFLQAYVCLLFGIRSKWQGNSLNSVSVSG